jgi:hypothetical protein
MGRRQLSSNWRLVQQRRIAADLTRGEFADRRAPAADRATSRHRASGATKTCRFASKWLCEGRMLHGGAGR